MLARAFARLVVVRPHELRGLLAATATVFCSFAAYSLLRPVREAMGITQGVENLPWLFAATFVAMLVAQPVYGWLTSHFRRTSFLPWVQLFFCANLLGFWAWFGVAQDHTWIARAYYVWLSVFSLFVVAVFWSLMADVYTREQAGRMFGFIAAGLSLGGLCGPWLGARLAQPIGTVNLLLVAAALLALSLVFLTRVLAWHREHGETVPGIAAGDRDRPLGGSALAAFRQVLGSPYLLLIALFVFLLTWISTFLYLEQAALVARTFATRDERTEFFNRLDFWVQAASLLVQTLLFSRLYRRFGFRSLLLSIPLLMVAGYAALALAPGFAVFVAVMMVRRVGEYAVTRPCRDMLWTAVPREQKYKAKGLVDTFVYRGGDALSAGVHKLLSGVLGFGLVGIAWFGAATALAWAAVALALSRRVAAQDAAAAAAALPVSGRA